jgi:transcriptional regulator with XRE-family HTH domain
MKAIYLRTARLKQHRTQAELAKLARVPQHTISKLETTASARPPYTTHIAIARAIGVDPDRLRFGPDPQQQRTRDRDLRYGRRETIPTLHIHPPAPPPARRRASPVTSDPSPDDTTPAGASGGTV